jgi:ferrous iron transporter FeoB
MKEEIKVAFVGNPNCGKTTLFNAYTGANLKIANWPGVTVEKKEGTYQYKNHHLKLIDLPGIYSLTSYTMEEKLTREYILNAEVDIIINIVDASSLERNLYLTLQLIELGKPVILALNMIDIVDDRGMKIDIGKLSDKLGVMSVPVCARNRTGLKELMEAVIRCKEQYRNPQPITYSREIESKIHSISEHLQDKFHPKRNLRWYAIKLLEMDSQVIAEYSIKLAETEDRNYEEEIINQKYDLIENIVGEVLVNKASKTAATDKVDKILTHRYLGLPIFLLIMALIFFLTFQIGGILKNGFEILLHIFSISVLHFLTSIQASEFVTSLIVEGIIAGVGAILTFLPNIFILFLCLAYLEDSGYMSRVAYIMDSIMGRLGLSGKAFIPLLLGFGCSVPAIMASRSLENMRDRRKVILITPFMSCSARLTIYVLFSQMFFGKMAMAAAYSMYVIGIIVAIIAAYIMNNKSDRNLNNALLIELPEYKIPNQRSILIYVWEKIKEYLTKAGTTIFTASIIIWVILNFGPGGMVEDMSQSFGAMIGKALAPALAPAGLGMWQIVLALISGIAAKEVVVSSFSILFRIGNITSPIGMAGLLNILREYGFGALNAYSLMVFCLLYIPCAATIGVIRREMQSICWTLFAILFQLGIAMLISTLVFQIGCLLSKL